MPRPIFLRGEDGQIKKVIRPGSKRNIARQRGFNASPEGFIVAAPVKSIVPTPAPHFPDGTLVTAENRGLEGGNWEAKRIQFENAIKKDNNICPDCSGDGWYVVADYQGEPEQRQCQLCNMTGKVSNEVFTAGLERKHGEHSIEDMNRSDCHLCHSEGLAKEEPLTLEEENNPTVVKTEDDLLKEYEDSQDNWVEVSIKWYEKVRPVVGEILSPESEADAERITEEFWEANNIFTNISNELILFNRKAQEDYERVHLKESWGQTNYASRIQWLETHKAEQQKNTLAMLNGRVADFRESYSKASLVSQEAESEETLTKQNALAQIQDMVRMFEETIFEDRKKIGISSIDKAQIDSMTYEQMLRKHRFAVTGDPLFRNGDPRSDYFQAHMKELQAKDPDGAVRASKNIGW